MEHAKNYRADGHPEPANGEQEDSPSSSRQLDIPVDSWDAYKAWCERIRDNWSEESAEQNSD